MPHIRGKTAVEVAYALGRAQCEDRHPLVVQNLYAGAEFKFAIALDTLRATAASHLDKDNKLIIAGGQSTTALVTWTNDRPLIQAVVGYGQSTLPGSPHYASYPGHAIVRQWTTITNSGMAPLVLNAVSLLALQLAVKPADLEGHYGLERLWEETARPRWFKPHTLDLARASIASLL